MEDDDDMFVPIEQELVFEEYGSGGGGYREEDDDEEFNVDYGDDIEEENIDLDGEALRDNDRGDDMIFEEEVSFGTTFSDQDRVGGRISSVAQIKSLMNIFGGSLGGKEGKLSFSNLSDQDILKLLLNNSVYSNKLNNYYPNTNFTALMEGMFQYLEYVPNIKYKNPSALFIGYLCTSRNGKFLENEFQKWKIAISVLNIYNSDVIRYHRLWNNIYTSKKS
jgi:hypothetical protein